MARASAASRAAGIPRASVPGTLHAVEHAAIGILPLYTICDRWDVGGVSTAWLNDTGAPTIVIYDGSAGGSGIAELGYAVADEHLATTLQLLLACSCEEGCPSCVQSPKCGNGNEPLDKRGRSPSCRRRSGRPIPEPRPAIVHCSTRHGRVGLQVHVADERPDQWHIGDGPIADDNPNRRPHITSCPDLDVQVVRVQRAASPRAPASTWTAVDRDRPGRLACRVRDQDLIARHESDLQHGEQEHQDDREKQGQFHGRLPGGIGPPLVHHHVRGAAFTAPSR